MKARYIPLPNAIVFGGFSGDDRQKIEKLCVRLGYKGISADNAIGGATLKSILQSKPGSTDTPVKDERFVIIHGGKPSVFLDSLKVASIEVPLRAVTTPTSLGWTLNQLIDELKKERQELEGV
ncbi:MAG: DUF3783 domain-containing protein [Ruminococcus sp.]|nr:DUF3783 domain-containing protein [Ruminococcus sp.]